MRRAILVLVVVLAMVASSLCTWWLTGRSSKPSPTTEAASCRGQAWLYEVWWPELGAPPADRPSDRNVRVGCSTDGTINGDVPVIPILITVRPGEDIIVSGHYESGATTLNDIVLTDVTGAGQAGPQRFRAVNPGHARIVEGSRTARGDVIAYVTVQGPSATFPYSEFPCTIPSSPNAPPATAASTLDHECDVSDNSGEATYRCTGPASDPVCTVTRP